MLKMRGGTVFKIVQHLFFLHRSEENKKPQDVPFPSHYILECSLSTNHYINLMPVHDFVGNINMCGKTGIMIDSSDRIKKLTVKIKYCGGCGRLSHDFECLILCPDSRKKTHNTL